MAPRAAEPGSRAKPPASGAGPDGVVRRAPFSDNPQVGARGQRTQQRILDAALRVFGDVGYHQCNIDAIGKVAGCSRVSFYQYFSSKDDVFRHLARQVARQLDASNDRLDPVTPDLAGWTALREWVGRYADVYERYEPVFNSFPAAAESDSTLAGDSVRTSDRYTAGLRSRVERTPLPPRDVDPLIDLLLTCLPRALDDGATLRHAAPRAYPLKALLDAYADVAHRTLFGRLPGLNVHDRSAPSPPRLPFREVEPAALASAPNGAARTALLHAARSVFATRGYHGTRVVDIVAAAGVSHGAFYSYFKSKDEVAHLLAAHAMREVSIVLSEIPPSAGEGAANRAALKRWLREYNRAQASETAMIRVRIDAGRQDDSMLADSAGLLDWGRRRLARFLSPRGFGDADTDAVVLLALLDALGTRERPARTIDAALQLIERGFLGR